MEIQFTKVVSSGNDFILLDNRGGTLGEGLASIIQKLCERKHSVGADGVLMLEEDPLVDFSMRYFNSDGSEADMCGNGGICIAFYAHSRGIAPQHMSFSSKAGTHSASVTGSSVKLALTDPKEVKLDVPFPLDGREITLHLVNSGVPHAVLLVDSVEKAEVRQLGMRIRSHPSLRPEGANVNFVECAGGDMVKVRTYERGVEGETLSCGTGAVASAIVAHLRRGVNPPVEVSTRGGILKVEFKSDKGEVSNVWLEGEGKITYEGRAEI